MEEERGGGGLGWHWECGGGKGGGVGVALGLFLEDLIGILRYFQQQTICLLASHSPK